MIFEEEEKRTLQTVLLKVFIYKKQCIEYCCVNIGIKRVNWWFSVSYT
jgi:hypothetical protein